MMAGQDGWEKQTEPLETYRYDGGTSEPLGGMYPCTQHLVAVPRT